MKVDENSQKRCAADTTPKNAGKSPADDATPGSSEPLGFAEQFENKVEDVGDSIFPWLARMVNKMFCAPNMENPRRN